MVLLPDQRVVSLFAVILLRYVIIALLGYLIFYVIFGKRWQHRKIQSRVPGANDYRREIGYSLITALIFTVVGYLTFLTNFREYTRVYTSIDQYGTTYFLV